MAKAAISGVDSSASFKMIEGVKKREADLKQQAHQLAIELGEPRRHLTVRVLTDTEFFENLQAFSKLAQQARRSGEKAG